MVSDRAFPEQPKVLIVFNPHAGQATAVRQSLEQAADLWRAQGWQVDLQATMAAGDATQIAKTASQNGVNIVVAAGGDGTVNEVMNGLVNTETALAVLPAGTVNIWAREMGLAMDVQRAAATTLLAQWRCVDVGRVRSMFPRTRRLSRKRVARPKEPLVDRHFLLMAGVGFDAAVTAGVKPLEKKRLGAIAYVKQAIQIGWNYRGNKVALRIDGKKIRGRFLMAVVGNSQLYGGVMKFTLDALIDDGLLDICVIQGRSMLKAPLRLVSIFSRSHHRDRRIKYYQAKQIQFLSRKPIPVQVDGDYLGQTPMLFEVVPQSLWVLVPPNADRSLWSNHTTDQSQCAPPIQTAD
ncbi:diacylglycerol kinase family lipid kinase [filamentous cyanobacterium LEGE 11480]|uniref:Diacylglycerol kinase family lipid kinase n=1 Tax=Romeriopsis navalis LEGE 11480 TaxID=2777977 RepID=A0A928VND8_9CYAN|nr:diacylglycerol kinase family protein [Romeriopsis navalis]MBE9029891.1 diacylglycerol kinase family lipid kinase [Romeriopsis navalis LEGE 11480]